MKIMGEKTLKNLQKKCGRLSNIGISLRNWQIATQSFVNASFAKYQKFLHNGLGELSVQRWAAEHESRRSKTYECLHWGTLSIMQGNFASG